MKEQIQIYNKRRRISTKYKRKYQHHGQTIGNIPKQSQAAYHTGPIQYQFSILSFLSQLTMTAAAQNHNTRVQKSSLWSSKRFYFDQIRIRAAAYLPYTKPAFQPSLTNYDYK
jgi:hypothetical protein